MTELNRLFDYIGHLPECPTWSAEQGALYWTDILQNEIHRYHVTEKQHSIISFPEEVGCFALREQGIYCRDAQWYLFDQRKRPAHSKSV